MKKFIKAAIKHPGALRATAKKEGLIKGSETLSASDLTKLKKSKNETTRRRASLAQTLAGMHRAHATVRM